MALDVIDIAQRRFEIMSRLNRRLYDPDTSELKTTALLEEHSEDIKQASGADRIVCHVEPSGVKLSREQAMLLSLLVAELMMNSTKHAFAPGSSGNVTITLKSTGPDHHLTFADDGRGFDPEARTSSLGLGSRIMEGLVNQLHGTMRTASGSSGTTVRVSIPAAD
jgi:two-component sensor histidine kinase